MTKIKFDLNTMQIMSLFDKVTRANLKDCIISDSIIIFIVEENEAAKAIGKKGANVRHLERSLKKKVKIAEFSSDIVRFMQNLAYPAKIREAEEKDGILTLTAADTQSRGMLIGRGASILRNFESIVKRYFHIQEIKVI
ncbi:NusA-like transcription termination signal-binding factor [Candidatus Woesearchaeota archaeon]|nr:NusA-like transcription termination signal-binding factor [Candidatus Woesearchaeota archaeon]